MRLDSARRITECNLKIRFVGPVESEFNSKTIGCRQIHRPFGAALVGDKFIPFNRPAVTLDFVDISKGIGQLEVRFSFFGWLDSPHTNKRFHRQFKPAKRRRFDRK